MGIISFIKDAWERKRHLKELDQVISSIILKYNIKPVEDSYYYQYTLTVNGQKINCLFRGFNCWTIHFDDVYYGEGALPLVEAIVKKLIREREESKEREKEEKLQNSLDKILKE